MKILLMEWLLTLDKNLEFTHAALVSFAFAFAHLAVPIATFASSSEPGVFGHVTGSSTSGTTGSSSSISPFAKLYVAIATFALVRLGIDLHVVDSSTVVRIYRHTCLVLCILLQELKSGRYHRNVRVHPGSAFGAILAPLLVRSPKKKLS